MPYRLRVGLMMLLQTRLMRGFWMLRGVIFQGTHKGFEFKRRSLGFLWFDFRISRGADSVGGPPGRARRRRRGGAGWAGWGHECWLQVVFSLIYEVAGFCPFDQVRAIRLDLSCIFSYLGTSLGASLYSENSFEDAHGPLGLGDKWYWNISFLGFCLHIQKGESTRK